MRLIAGTLLVMLLSSPVLSAERPISPPIYLWYEPEWFEGVEGSFAYWTGPKKTKPTGKWGVAGPGISAEWSQGGESEWNSMGAPAEETRATCGRDVIIPRAGKYRLWVRYVDHRGKLEPFKVHVEQQGRPALAGEFGTQPLVPVNDEHLLYWGFAFGWSFFEGQLEQGPANLGVLIDKPGEAWRQVDALLLTDDLAYEPVGREKSPFAYLGAFTHRPERPEDWRGQWQGPKETGTGAQKRPLLAGRDFTMWTQVEADPKWWSQQKPETLTKYDLFFQFSPGRDIRKAFQKEFTGRKDVPIMSWPDMVPGFYLGHTPDLSPGTPARQWLERTKSPFYILTNYANPQYTDKTGPATYQALTGPLADQFLGYIHGEAIGSPGVSLPARTAGADRRAHVHALGKHLRTDQAKRWSAIYKTPVPESHWAKGISCLSCESIALAHLFHETGAKVVGYEEDATNVHVPMRIAFERGAARQYGGAWINYASGNFGDACNYFTQDPRVNRGAGGWFHSKYAVTDGVTIGWYRKLYYLNYLGGASAVFWEQGLENQWLLPGPGEHPIQLSPFGRATVDFQEFVKRLPDRGEPLTPVALLLGHGHGYERVNYECKMLKHFMENDADRELRELFNVCWHPSAVTEGQPAAPDVQSLPNGVYGNVFDVLVDRPGRAKAMLDYPVVYAAGAVELGGAMLPIVEEYLKRGGTLVVNIEAAKNLPVSLLGLKPTGKKRVADAWSPRTDPSGGVRAGGLHLATPFEVLEVELHGAGPLVEAGLVDPESLKQSLPTTKEKAPLITSHRVGPGMVIVTLAPRMLGLDERAHPALPYLTNALTTKLLPIQVYIPKAGTPETLGHPAGEIMYQINRTKDGYLVLLVNNRGVDKTQNGIARVDRRAHVDVVLSTALPVKSVKETTQPRELKVEKAGDSVNLIRVRIHPGDVQVVYIGL